MATALGTGQRNYLARVAATWGAPRGAARSPATLATWLGSRQATNARDARALRRTTDAIRRIASNTA